MGTLRGLVVKLMADSANFVSGLNTSASFSSSIAAKISGNAQRASGSWAASSAQSAMAQQKAALEAAKLNNEITIQSDRLNLLRTKFDESNPRVEKARLAVQGLKLQLAELGSQQQKTTDHTSRFAGLIENAGSRIGNTFTGLVSGAARVGVALAQVAAVASGVFAAGVGAATTAIIGTVNAAANWGDQLDSIGDVLGTNARDSAALSVAITSVGGDVANITTQMAFMSKGLVDEKGALGSTGQALKDLGISAFEVGRTYKANVPLTKMSAEETANLKRSLESATARYHDLGNTIARGKNVTESQRVQYAHLGADIAAMSAKLGDAGKTVTKTFTEQGPMKDTAKLLQEVATKIDAMPDGLEKTSVMMKVFGKSGKDMSDTIHALAGSGLDEAREKAKLFGLDIGEDGVSNAVAFKRSLADVRMMGQGLAVSIGSQLMPTVLPLIKQFSDWAISVMPQVASGIKKVVGEVSQFVTGLTTGQGKFGSFGMMVQTAFTTIKNAAVSVINWVITNWPQISAIVGGALAGIGSFVSAYFIPAVIAISAALGAAIAWVQTNWPQISAAIGGVLNGIGVFAQTAVVPMVQLIIAQLQKVVGWVQVNWPLIQSTVSIVFNAIKSIIDAVVPVLLAVITFVFNEIKVVVETAVNTVLGIIKAVMQAINGDWAGAWQTVQQTVIGIFEGINQFFGGIPAKLLEFGRQMIDGLVLGILSNGDKVIKALRGLIDQAIADVKKILGLGGGNASPAYQAGANVAQSISAGYAAAIKPLVAPAFARANTANYAGARRQGAGGFAQDAGPSKQIVIPIYLGGREVDRYIVDVVKETVEQERGRYG